MLKLRIIAALIAAPLVVAALFYTSQQSFSVIFLVLAGIALFEWGNLAGLESLLTRALYLALYCLLAYLLYVSNLLLFMLALSSMFWLLALLMVLFHPRFQSWLENQPLHLAAGLVVALGAWSGLLVLKALAAGEWLLVWVMILVWGADVGAYFSGKSLGRHKLAPDISPGKTWEGVIGGLMLSMAATLAMVLYIPDLQSVNIEILLWLTMAFCLAGISIAGDLFESILKRHVGVKDSGRIFPGHGGLLDRVDALVAVLPLFAGLIYLNLS